MGLENGKTKAFTRGIGRIIRCMVSGFTLLTMEMSTRAIGTMESLQV